MKHKVSIHVLLGAVVLSWVFAFLIISFTIKDWSQRGQFGDMFGALNVLFSGFAFAALYFTISLQQQQLARQDEQLELQRQELRLQREEMAASRMELAKQADAQLALTRATIAQVRVASVNAEIEAQKLWSDTPRRNEAIEKIQAASASLAALATTLEAQS